MKEPFIIYITSSWRNQHAVEMLTMLLRERGYEVKSFVENSFGEGHVPGKPFNSEEWINTEHTQRSFKFDTRRATTSDLVIYIGPSGMDAWAEIGAAWQSGVEVLGLWSKGEEIGLMRHMVTWFHNFRKLLDYILEYKEKGQHSG